MADFAAGLERINALADQSPGFVWRLQTAEGDATSIRPFENEILRARGPTAEAFTFRQAFPPPDAVQGPSYSFGDECPAT
jgi:hypothetical protein